MKYSMHLRQYLCKSPYPYYVIQADEDLTKFHVWSKMKTMNAWLYSEQEVLDMIEEKYPGAERIERPVRSRPQVLTRKTYLAKGCQPFPGQEYFPGRGYFDKATITKKNK